MKSVTLATHNAPKAFPKESAEFTKAVHTAFSNQAADYWLNEIMENAIKYRGIRQYQELQTRTE